MKSQVEGGYLIIKSGELAQLIELRKEKKLSFSALRVYLCAHLIAASRYKAQGEVFFKKREIYSRLGKTLSEEGIERALEELKRLALLEWSEKKIKFLAGEKLKKETLFELKTSGTRPVPIPRYIFRVLLRLTKPSEVVAVLAHLLRCMWKKGKEILAKGLVRASWVVKFCGISERSVRNARKWLAENEFIKEVTVTQRVKNRFGACFEFALKQLRRAKEKAKRVRELLSAKNEFAPPYKQVRSSRSTSTKNQKNYTPAKGGPSGFLSKKLKEPNLKAIILEDLRFFSRLEELFRQALAANWLTASEQSAQRFVCAAFRATRAQGNPVKIFVGIVKKGLFHHITNAQEDYALAVLRRYRETHPGAFFLKGEKPGEEFTTEARRTRRGEGAEREVRTAGNLRRRAQNIPQSKERCFFRVSDLVTSIVSRLGRASTL